MSFKVLLLDQMDSQVAGWVCGWVSDYNVPTGRVIVYSRPVRRYYSGPGSDFYYLGPYLPDMWLSGSIYMHRAHYGVSMLEDPTSYIRAQLSAQNILFSPFLLISKKVIALRMVLKFNG